MAPPSATPSPDDASLIELKREVTEANEQLTEALKVYGEFSREARNAHDVLKLAMRRLDAAEFKATERARTDALTPREIVDEILGR